MTTTSIFCHHQVIPYILRRSYPHGSGNLIGSALFAIHNFANNTFLMGVFGIGFMLLVAANSHILYVERCFSDKRLETGEQADLSRRLTKYRWFVFDCTSEFNSGIVIALMVLLTFGNIAVQGYRLIRHFTKSKQTSQERKVDEGFIDKLLTRLLQT